MHDAQLSEDPELLQAAGAVTLLALENADLEAAWKESMDELVDSRARLVNASDRERRRLERDLHDGAQQRLFTIRLGLRLAQESADGDLAADLEALGSEAEEAVEELRTLAHGIYPTVLQESGLADALRSVTMRAPIPIQVKDAGIGRCSATVEAAIYFCSLEAVQNTIKHGGPDAHVTVTLGRDGDAVHFAIADDGVGMDVPARSDGVGLVSMRDRIGAVGGDLHVLSSPGRGTTVQGTIPTDGASRTSARTEGAP
jgi:signal transduction histidine kinase